MAAELQKSSGRLAPHPPREEGDEEEAGTPETCPACEKSKPSYKVDTEQFQMKLLQKRLNKEAQAGEKAKRKVISTAEMIEELEEAARDAKILGDDLVGGTAKVQLSVSTTISPIFPAKKQNNILNLTLSLQIIKKLRCLTSRNLWRTQDLNLML